MSLITLTTDFGLRDGYVGIMKGVIAGIAPQTTVIDLTHEIAPQAVRSAAYLLWAALPYFPPETVHLAVVDPGVGTARRALAARTPWGYTVGPDNGLFSYVWAAAPPEQIVELTHPAYRLPALSATFHGRDLFAPAAAHLANGIPLTAFGPLLPDPVRWPLPRLDVMDDGLRGEVLHVDRFGNCITSLGRLAWEEGGLRLTPAWGQAPALWLRAERAEVLAAGRRWPLRRTYGAVAPGEPLALIGSAGLLELAVAQGSAAALGITVGAEVVLTGRGGREKVL